MLPKVILQHHCRHPVRQHVYPGVMPSTSTSAAPVEGILLFELSPIEVKLLDYFEEEGVDYRRTDVQVQIPVVDSLDKTIQTYCKDDYFSDGIFKTQAYIWLKDTSTLDITKGWDFEEFRQKHLDWYLKSTVKPCRVEAEKYILSKNML